MQWGLEFFGTSEAGLVAASEACNVWQVISEINPGSAGH